MFARDFSELDVSRFCKTVTTETLRQTIIQSMKTEFAPALNNAEAQRTQRLAEKGINNLLCVSLRPRRLCVKLPLAALLLCVLALIPAASPAATNDLTALLQQGLFEEQANGNLDAAIVDYQSLAAQFDKDRQLAATAVFRLGECYRMQGKTNEATAQYQRILHDFSDQTTLATLSRQNLTGMGVGAQQRSENVVTRVQASTDEEEQEIRAIQQMIQNSPDLINATLAGGISPLKNAAAHGWLKVAAFLLDHGADVNAGDPSPLGQAVGAGN